MSFENNTELKELFGEELRLMNDLTLSIPERVKGFTPILDYLLETDERFPKSFNQQYSWIYERLRNDDLGEQVNYDNRNCIYRGNFRNDRAYLTLLIDDYIDIGSAWIILITTNDKKTSKLEIRCFEEEVLVEIT